MDTSKDTRKRSRKAGLAPGTLIHIGEGETRKTGIRMMVYNEEQVSEAQVEAPGASIVPSDEDTVTWVSIDGIHDLGVIEEAGRCFGLHPLTLEDIVNTEQRPKMEDYEDYLFIVMKMLRYDAEDPPRMREDHELKTEQISLIVKKGVLISFQESEVPLFVPIRERIRKGQGRLRKSGSDYLAYALLDAVVDQYFGVLEKIGERLELLQDELVEKPSRDTLIEIHRLKREMILLRRSVWPLRELVTGLTRGESRIVQEATLIYLRDVYDHAVQVMDTVEMFREMASEMLDIYLSSMSNRMNEVMKVLTVIATIFIPLTFIAGVYGMNFKYMPELEWHWGYPAVMGFMAVLAFSMLFVFRYRKWL